MIEFDLIARIHARCATRPDVALGIGDDAALLRPAPGMQLAVAMDTLNAGVHFPEATSPADIGWKALAVNLSDLASMGAVPRLAVVTLGLRGDESVADLRTLYAALGVLLLLVLAMIWIVPKLFRFVRRLFDRLAGLGGVRTGMTGGAGDLERKA